MTNEYLYPGYYLLCGTCVGYVKFGILGHLLCIVLFSCSVFAYIYGIFNFITSLHCNSIFYL